MIWFQLRSFQSHYMLPYSIKTSLLSLPHSFARQRTRLRYIEGAEHKLGVHVKLEPMIDVVGIVQLAIGRVPIFGLTQTYHISFIHFCLERRTIY